MVKSTLRRQGIGFQLLKAAERIAGKLGYSKIYCGTNKAIELLQRNNWQFLERVKNGSHCIQIVALVSNSRQIKAAQQAGANSVLITGFLATDLRTALQPTQGNVTTRKPLHQIPTSTSTGTTPSITWEMLLKGDHDYLPGLQQ